MRRRRGAGCLLVGLVAGAVAIVLALGYVITQLTTGSAPRAPQVERCVATASDRSVVIDLEQAENAAIIAGVAIRRALPPRAVSIALATAYQESGIHNLDYGDRDSVGLFQQRPSQGWGTVEQIMDPWYSAGRFYDALVKITDWQRRDITEVAQAVQRSGYPDAYRDHEADARVLASVLTGQSPAGLTCLDRTTTGGDAAALRSGVTRAVGVGKASVNGQVVVYRAASTAQAWAIAAHAVANAGAYGVGAVQLGDRAWLHGTDALPGWARAEQSLPKQQVIITLR